MASLIRDKNGRKRIGFTALDRSRKTIRLGKATLRQAEAVKMRIEQLQLAASGASGVVDPDTIQWLARLDDAMYEKLAAVGLIASRTSTTLGDFIDTYIAERTDVKRGTATVYGHTRRTLIDFFGKDKPMREITPGDADKWRLYLLEQGLSENTVRRRCGIAKQFMKAALRRNLISSNAFEDLPSGTRGNTKRFYFITCSEAEKVLEACPDTQWRLIFALSRFGGLRCPSEHLALRWSDVDWEHSKITVHSSKTEHLEGGGTRIIPIFPELFPYLRDAFEQAPEGSEYVITRYRDSNCNLRTQLLRIIHQTGLKPWPKLFQNLRSTRQTELCQEFPEHVVCAWIGNSKAVAREHYLQVTDEHFEKATQNPTQQMSAGRRIESQPVHEPAMYGDKRSLATQCKAKVGRVGFEPT